MYIKGFKTFARPVRLPLMEGITAIVGPNGSGKSNITDALLFALGEGSPSILRAGLMSDLIFSGSDSLPPAGMAEVTLVLDNTSGDISLPYEEVSLTRRISRGGETEYRINGARARLTDVRTVAGEAGVGRHSVLRQGAVDAIVSGGAAACRTALEEAAGLGVFRRRRVAAVRKLERAADRLESSRRLEAELSAQLRRIEAEAVAAREYRELETRYRELSLAHLYSIASKDLDGARVRLKELEERESALRTRQEALREARRLLEIEEKELEGRVRGVEHDILGLENGSEGLRAETLRAERALLRLEGALDRGTDRSRLVSRLETELGVVTTRVRQLEEQLGGLEEEHSRKKEAFRRAEELVAQRRAEHSRAAEGRARVAGDLRILQERRERVDSRIGEAHVLGRQEIERLVELGEGLDSYSSDASRQRGARLLGRLEELREIASERVVAANRRSGALAVLVGRTEAEIQALRSSKADRAATTGKRLCEVLRPVPGYEAAVEAALGELATGVFVETLADGMRFLSGGDSAERVVVRLDAEGVPKNGTPPGLPLLDCVYILDDAYAEALERLLAGVYVLEGAEHDAPKSGYDAAVTRDGLRFTRTSASRRVVEGDFARQARLAREEERLKALKGRVGEELYDLREAALSISRRLDGRSTEVEVLASLSSRTARVARLLASEPRRRARKAEAARERISADESELRAIDAEIGATEVALGEARGAEQRTKEELDAALSSAESEYAASRETAADLARVRTQLQSARHDRVRISRGLANLKDAKSAGTKDNLTRISRRLVEHARRLDDAARGRLARLRRHRSEAAGTQAAVAEKRAGIAGEVGDLAGELARTASEAAALRGELALAREAAGAAEAEISEEWGANLEIAGAFAAALAEDAEAERERARIARKLKNFGDVNLLAISQEGHLRERYDFVSAQRADAEEAAVEIQRIIQNVDEEIEARFEATFREVRRVFSSIVPRMLEGAEGELEVSEEGVEIGLRLRRRGWRPLRVLSGGERSLLALSFLFSIFLGRLETRSGGSPRVFCMLDEAEAALDDLNLARFLAVVDSHRANGQFLLVTHQKRTMAAADVLYGVTPDASGATVVVSKRLTGD